MQVHYRLVLRKSSLHQALFMCVDQGLSGGPEIQRGKIHYREGLPCQKWQASHYSQYELAIEVFSARTTGERPNSALSPT